MGRLLMHNCKTLILTFVMLAGLGGTAGAQTPPRGGQGPGPNLKGGEEGDAAGPGPPKPVAGSINVIVPSPTSADTVFVGTVSGGVWVTSNATDPSPTWTPLTDQQLPELPINSLAVSPVNSNTLFAGTGST